jgi:hypothetical protein
MTMGWCDIGRPTFKLLAKSWHAHQPSWTGWRRCWMLTAAFGIRLQRPPRSRTLRRRITTTTTTTTRETGQRTVEGGGITTPHPGVFGEGLVPVATPR